VIDDLLGGRPEADWAVAAATPGATGALRHAIASFLEPGQTLLTTSYYWGPYRTLADEADRHIATFRMFDDRGRLDCGDLERKLRSVMESQGRIEAAVGLRKEAGRVENQHALANSIAGRLGRAVEPVLRPLGFDWQIGVGVISSFAAREVIVSTLAVVYGVGADAAGENPDSLYDTMRAAKRTDGTAVFTVPTCASLLVFYVLAMQCLATQAVTRRETGTWRWPIFQIGYMSVLAYTASFVTYQLLSKMIGA
jgi:hypothetical protein